MLCFALKSILVAWELHTNRKQKVNRSTQIEAVTNQYRRSLPKTSCDKENCFLEKTCKGNSNSNYNLGNYSC
uniref:Uncharacterized protein n=1 Tax=Salix viminalis TaxID=40686 RepID=A0A6N2N2K4_SALVM